MEVYAIKVTLIGTRPPVWRRILVPRDITLRNLHRTLQTVMGWTNAHLHQFVLPGTRNFGLRQGFGGKVGNENRTTLGALLDFPGAKLLYEYDFGDCWRHELLLERVLLGDESFRQVCVAGERPCPPEDSGGPAGFAELLKAFQEKDHPEHDYAREWLSDHFASGSFNPDEINRRLHRRRY
jgi:Plasmid pRiA4b ORF-3-like protein